MYYGGFLYSEAYNLPVAYKHWFVERLNKELSKKDGEAPAGTRAAHQNSPDVRSLMGQARSQVPSRLRRFT